MTYSEAVEILTLDEQMQRKLPNLKEVYEVAVKALKKQIPTKCVKDDCERDCCPVCGWIIGYGDTIQPHCHNCGQALDWSS